MLEEEIARQYTKQEMRCPTHLSIGQELAGAALGIAAKKTDSVFSTHRSHAHYLGKGGSINTMLAEIYGKSTGCCAGMGGSMHLRDPDVGFEASTAIVGNSIPLGVGVALANKLDGNDSVAVVFVGDAVFETGVFYETLNIAATFQVPVLFICENNLYSVYSPLKVRQPIKRKNYEIAEKIGLKSKFIDGMDAIAVLDGLSDALNYCREMQAPSLIEMTAYRWREHCGPNFDNQLGYRTEAEYEKWKELDYLEALKKTLLKNKILSEQLITDKTQNLAKEIENAFNFAKKSSFPTSPDGGLIEYCEAT